jgi:hypothetical protein
MTTYQSQEFYSSLFHLLLGRELSDEDYSTRFSALDIHSYITSLLDSPEFVEKNICQALDQPNIPIVDHTKLIDLSNGHWVQDGIVPAVALSVGGLQTPNSCQSTRQHQRFFPISANQAYHTSNQANSLQGIDFQLLLQALQASRGAVDLCNARDALAPFLLRTPGLLTSDQQGNVSLSLELILLPTSPTLRRYSLFSSLFTSLLSRSLTLDEYDLHFSSLSSLEFTALLLRSPECLAKNIFEVLPSCACARILSTQQLVVQLPGALDEGVYILLSIDSSESLIIAIRLRTVSRIVETATESATLMPTDPGCLSDAITAAMIQYNSFTNEDLFSVVSNFTISTVVDVETLVSLQSSYQLPDLAGIFSSASSCTVSLIAASQLSGLVGKLESRSASNLIIAI